LKELNIIVKHLDDQETISQQQTKRDKVETKSPSKQENLQIVLPQQVSMVCWDDKYGFAALPISNTAEIELEHQILLQPLPV